jgi:probable HAF family extracellular repeat protein
MCEATAATLWLKKVHCVDQLSGDPMLLRRKALAAGILGVCSSWAGAQPYHAVPLPQGTAAGMSSCGWVTANAVSAGSPTAFIFHDGTFQQLNTDNFVAHSVNNYGDVVGYAIGGKISLIRVMAITLYGGSGAAGIVGNNQVDALGTGINDAINASGTLQLAIGQPPVRQWPVMYLDAPHTVTKLERGNSAITSGINNSNEVVGSVLSKNASQAFVYANRAFTNLKVIGATSTAGNAISDAGVVVGSGTTSTGTSEGFVYYGGVGSFIGRASGTYNHASTLLAVNNTGVAVGNIQDASGATHALLYTSGSLIDLNDVSDAPVPLVTAVGISDAGEIAVNAADGSSYVLVPGGVYPPNTCKTR